MKKFSYIVLILSVYCFYSISINAGNLPGINDDSSLSPFFQVIVDGLTEAEEKIASLADAMPEDKYSWRPAEGVRSVSEVFVHAAGANHFILSFVGKQMPEGSKPDIEKTMTGKKDIQNFIKQSYQEARDFISKMKDDDLEKEVETPIGKFSQRKLLVLLLNHTHEHIGQSIAYGRMNGVTPPWSKKEKEN